MATNGTATKKFSGSLSAALFEDMQSKVDNLNIASSDTEAESQETEQKVVDEIESLCMNCHENGITKLLLTKIPFFREIIIMSFSCDKCGLQNSEIQSAGEIQERGSKYIFRLDTAEDLQRQIVKGDSCTIRIEEIDLEIPSGKGRFTNIEGLVSTVRDDLNLHEDARLEQMPDVGRQVAVVIERLTSMVDGNSFPFTISVDDPSGNSWIEPSPKDKAGKYKHTLYKRTSAQNGMLGLGDDVPNPSDTAPSSQNPNAGQAPETEIRPEYKASSALVGGTTEATSTAQNNVDNDDIIENQVYTFPATCPGCTRPCDTHMKMVDIPFFKQVVLMSTSCESCGYKSNEVKTGGVVPEKGQRITLHVESEVDLARDVLKSESASLSCPELNLSVEPGTLGGKFTTVEGLLSQFRKDLRAQAFALEDGDSVEEIEKAQKGDSMEPEKKRTWNEFFDTLGQAIEGKIKYTLIIQDPLGSSYVQSLTAPAKDPQIDVEEYERTKQEEEDLGLADMNTEDYESKDDDKDATTEGNKDDEKKIETYM